jgi:hypothetical protein
MTLQKESLMRLAERVLVVFLCLGVASPGLRAQQPNIVDPSTVDQALTEKAQNTAAKRQTVITALRHAQVKEVANGLGLQLTRAEAAVSTLDGETLDQLTAQAQEVNEALEGGQTVRLNVLWIILGLLVLLLIIVAVD